MAVMRAALKSLLRSFGYDVVRARDGEELPPDFSPEDAALWKLVAPHTMTSPERVFALRQAVRYVVEAKVPGDIVECGVWKGGSMMAVARTLLDLGSRDRALHLFDTYEGMPAPTGEDVSYTGEPAERQLDAAAKDDLVWAMAGLEQVKANVLSTGYPAERIRFVKGKVEDTIPAHAPEKIALLRLDTDWYESTRHELIHLYPRLSPGGVLIIDDYGHWQGARRAVDEYFAGTKAPILLNRIDYTGRLGLKTGV